MTCTEPSAAITKAYEEMRAFLAHGRLEIWTGHYDPAPQIVGRAVCCLARHRHRAGNTPTGAFVYAGYAFEWHVELAAEPPLLVLGIVRDVLRGI